MGKNPTTEKSERKIIIELRAVEVWFSLTMLIEGEKNGGYEGN
jgi:hypothetical protein